MSAFLEDDPGSYRERVEEAVARAKAERALEAPGDPITVRIPRAMEMLGIGRTKLYDLINEGEIDTIKVGSATLVVVTSLKAFVMRQRGLVRLA
jgi:excisionase family DNA binding protein